jgi:hypothetical protein
LREDESFSQVIKRGRWDATPSTGAALLRALENAPLPSKRTLQRLERAQSTDKPPGDAWTD